MIYRVFTDQTDDFADLWDRAAFASDNSFDFRYVLVGEVWYLFIHMPIFRTYDVYREVAFDTFVHVYSWE